MIAERVPFGIRFLNVVGPLTRRCCVGCAGRLFGGDCD